MIGAVLGVVGIWDFMEYQAGVAAGVGSNWTISGCIHSLDAAWPLFGYLLVFGMGFLTCHLFGLTTTTVETK